MLSEEGCLETLYAALALAHSSDVADVKRQLAPASNGDGQPRRRNDVVRWISAIWAGGPQAAAGTAAACLQSISWEAAVPHLSGALLCLAYSYHKVSSGTSSRAWAHNLDSTTRPKDSVAPGKWYLCTTSARP